MTVRSVRISVGRRSPSIGTGYSTDRSQAIAQPALTADQVLARLASTRVGSRKQAGNKLLLKYWPTWSGRETATVTHWANRVALVLTTSLPGSTARATQANETQSPMSATSAQISVIFCFEIIDRWLRTAAAGNADTEDAGAVQSFASHLLAYKKYPGG